MSMPRIFRTIALLLGSAIAATLLASCSLPQPTASFVGDSSTGSYLKLPLGYESKSLAKGPNISVLSFSPEGSVGLESLTPAPAALSGIMVARTPVDTETLELLEANAFLANFDASVAGGQVTVTDKRVIDVDGAAGRSVSYRFTPDKGNEISVEQLTVVDAESKMVRTIILGCTTECFKDNEYLRKQIVSTWKVDNK